MITLRSELEKINISIGEPELEMMMTTVRRNLKRVLRRHLSLMTL